MYVLRAYINRTLLKILFKFFFIKQLTTLDNLLKTKKICLVATF